MEIPNTFEAYKWLCSASCSLNEAEIIINQYPKVLYPSFQETPLVVVCSHDEPRIEMIQYLIQEGIKRNIGGSDGRGGLLLKSRFGDSPLEILIGGNKLATLKSLAAGLGIPLFFDRDILDFNLLHRATFFGHAEMIQWLLQICPESVGSRDKHGNLPIHYSFSDLHILQILLKEGIHQQVGGEHGIGGLLQHGLISPDCNVMTTIDMLFLERSLDAVIPALKHLVHGLPILQGAIFSDISPMNLRKIITNFDCSLSVDSTGRLPIHIAAIHGIKWEHGMKEIIMSDQRAMEVHDPETGLPPFALAAARRSGSYDLSSIYAMLRFCPSNF